MGITRRSNRLRTMVAILVVGLLLVGVGGTAIALVTGGSNDSAPTVDTSPTLQLSRTSTAGDAADAASSAAGYQLAGTLGESTDEGVVISPADSTASEARVRALLSALGMTSISLTQVAGGWTATGRAAGQKAAFALDESAGNLWQYGRGALADCLAVNPGSKPSDSASCSTTNSPTKKIAGPGRARLLKDAAGVFKAVGVTPGTGLTANDDGQGATYLSVPLTVEQLPVVGVNLSVGADAKGVVSGLGLLDPTYSPVGKYPLISERAGFDQLVAQPQPAIATACPTNGKVCPRATPAKVTAARLAWLTSQDSGRTVLVPAWQYEVDGFYGPAVVAVSPQYLSTAAAS